ncbi:type II secretion system F family protein [Fuchsiella alkaliacetigena]|uniref:type II secretion system F family protein n=1 Tax=Fuchsiella alkaliacetigena TaxID=957042 RepID=UPI00200B07CD|nr:type II secretion system F family protein [Fuchsiella alkaliacetigena]MCK8825279.1 type II secretion system F family protein [Fuchsiella alkaliacetigena]
MTEGRIEAESKDLVVARLRNRGYYITFIEEVSANKSSLRERLRQFQKVNLQDLALFCRQLATMIDAGLTLVRALSILAEQISKNKLKEAINSVRENVEGGMAFSEALAEEDHIFPQLFISMIRAGEVGGVLDEILNEMADHFERENNLNQQITSALVYPIVIMLVAMGVIIFLVAVVLPTFVDMFAGLDIILPLPTRILMLFSWFLINYWYLILISIITMIYGVYRYYQSRAGRRKIDNLLLQLPLIGDLIIKVSIARFSKTFSVLISNGVTILKSFEVVSGIMNNKVIAEKMMEAQQSISKGQSITLPFMQDDLFPSMVLQMIRVGEESGDLDVMLAKVADFYEQEVEYKIETMVSLIEPAMILFLGVIVGGIVISVMMPMFELMQGF